MKPLLIPKFAIASILILTWATPAVHAGQNPHVVLPLHAKVSTFEPCSGYLPFDCYDHRGTFNVPPGPVTIFLFVFNYTCIAGVQTAFELSPGWTFSFGLWDCQPGQLCAVTPAPPFGPTAGTITTAFNLLNGPAVAVIGRMFFTTGTTGCLGQVQSSYPFLNHVLDCEHGIDQVAEGDRMGRICVLEGGYNPCDPMVPVESTTWGRVKAQY